ncbi:MAG: exosortase/archaeosortase family protein [FCB group bacterium]|nr:exosortase/archaeosortase family protein [FCB group bacterium]
MTTTTDSASYKKSAISLFIALGLFLLIYFPVLSGLVTEWYNDDNYSHGFLIPFISGYLIWKKRARLKELINPAGDNTGLPIFLAGMALFVLSTAAAEYFTLRLSLIITLYGLVWYLLGRRVAIAAWFELLFLVFMIPLPYVIYYAATFPMQLFATKVTVKILNMIGMTAVRQGNIIHLPGYSLEVAEACSGLRSLISLLALGAVYARTTQKGLPRQIILFLSTIPIAVGANIFRILFTSVGAYTISRELAEDFLHELSGMMVFIVAFIMLFIWGGVIKMGSKKI